MYTTSSTSSTVYSTVSSVATAADYINSDKTILRTNICDYCGRMDFLDKTNNCRGCGAPISLKSFNMPRW